MQERVGRNKRQEVDAEELDTSAIAGTYGYLVRRAHERNYRAFNSRFADVKLNTAAYATLTVVQQNPGVRQGRIAEELGIQDSNMAALVKELMQRKLLYRTKSKHDGRAYGLALTRETSDFVDVMKRRAAVVDKENTKGLSPAERKTLISLLTKIATTND